MNIKKLNEELARILNEIEIDPSFNDYINQRREQQKNRDKIDMERDKEFSDRHPDDEYWKKNYEQSLAKYMGKHEADNILKTIYDKCHIDLENGGIKEIPVPKNPNELKKQITPNETAVILKRGDFISVIQGSYSDGKVVAYASYANNNYQNSSFIDTASEDGWNGKTFDLSRANSLSTAINKGLFDKAWLVYGGSTQKKMQDRKAAYRGSKDDLRSGRKYYWHDVDKSGYIKRDLKQELAKLTKDVKKQDFDKVKDSVAEIRKNFIKKIKESELEDISTQDLEAIVIALKNVEKVDFNSYGDVDDMKKSQREIETRIERLNSIIDRTFA